MQTENVTYVWNDVACLEDDRAVAFVCKTLFQLPAEVVYSSLGALTTEEIRCRLLDGKVCGELCLLVEVFDEQQHSEQLQLVIPFTGAGEEEWQFKLLDTVYLQGQLLCDRLLIEAVLSRPQANLPREPRVILGEIRLQEVLELPEKWPSSQQLLGSQILSQLDQVELQTGNLLQLSGKHLVAVLYEGVPAIGERLFLYQEARPFQASVQLSHQLSDLIGIELNYQSLTAQLLEPRKMQIDGTCVLFAQVEDRIEVAAQEEHSSMAAPEPNYDQVQMKEPIMEEISSSIESGVAQHKEILRETLEAALQEVMGSAIPPSAAPAAPVHPPRERPLSTDRLHPQAQQSKNPVRPQPQTMRPQQMRGLSQPQTQPMSVPQQSQQPPQISTSPQAGLQPQAQAQQGMPPTTTAPMQTTTQLQPVDRSKKSTEQINRRSQRQQLSKYMRNLNGMVSGPCTTRNFDLQQQEEQTEE